MFRWSNSIDLGVGGIDGDEDGVETSASWSATNFCTPRAYVPGLLVLPPLLLSQI